MLPQQIKLSWVHDLGSPTIPGKFIYKSVQVDVTPDRFNAVQIKLAGGAADVRVTAIRVDSGAEVYYLLGSVEAIE